MIAPSHPATQAPAFFRFLERDGAGAQLEGGYVTDFRSRALAIPSGDHPHKFSTDPWKPALGAGGPGALC